VYIKYYLTGAIDSTDVVECTADDDVALDWLFLYFTADAVKLKLSIFIVDLFMDMFVRFYWNQRSRRLTDLSL